MPISIDALPKAVQVQLGDKVVVVGADELARWRFVRVQTKEDGTWVQGCNDMLAREPADWKQRLKRWGVLHLPYPIAWRITARWFGPVRFKDPWQDIRRI